MSDTVVLPDEDLRGALRALSGEIQAALAFSRATLQTLASLSPEHQAVAEQALEGELSLARRFDAAPQTLDLIFDARARLREAAATANRAEALELALIAAADALPDARAAG